MTKKHVHIIKMGGTIEFVDPAYEAINKNLMKLDTSIESYLHNLIKPHFNFSSETVAEKDSRDLNAEDRQKLLKAILSTPHNNVLVTHGTFTMSDTAVFLNEQELNGKTVILTGSMVPITGFTTSDAGFNLGFSVASFNELSPGVYICMNGGLFAADEVSKNIEAFRFE